MVRTYGHENFLNENGNTSQKWKAFWLVSKVSDFYMKDTMLVSLSSTLYFVDQSTLSESAIPVENFVMFIYTCIY